MSKEILTQINKTHNNFNKLIEMCYNLMDSNKELANKLLSTMDNHPDSDFKDMLNKLENIIEKE